MTDETFEKVIDTASSLFIKRGVTKTQISHIASESGIATGSVYHLFENKNALFQYTILSVFTDFSLSEIPYKAINDKMLLQKVHSIYQKLIDTFKNKKDDESYTFSKMVYDAYDFVSTNARTNTIIESNINDVGVLKDEYLFFRKQFFELIMNFLVHFASEKSISSIKDIKIATVFFVETLATWAMHIPYKSFETYSGFTAEKRREAAVNMLLKAFGGHSAAK